LTDPETYQTLTTEAELALAHTEPNRRGALRIFLELDSRLARIVSGTTEPMLGQMRLAWWRDTLGTPANGRPSGDAVLDGIAAHWPGRETALVRLVDGWEHLLTGPPLSELDARGFAEGRRDALIAVYDRGADSADYAAFAAAAWNWAIADVAANVSDVQERAMLVQLGLGVRQSKMAPKRARGLAVLGALGLRALQRGGRPLMEGRGASLVATRAAIFGR
jgi:phytoene synthase